MKSYQERVGDWMQQCFGPEISSDRTERVFRFLEESLELAQALGASKKEAELLVSYVFGRPTGEYPQEIGCVMVSLAALCNAAHADLDRAAEMELARCCANTECIRARHAAKPVGIRTSLPGPHPGTTSPSTTSESST